MNRHWKLLLQVALVGVLAGHPVRLFHAKSPTLQRVSSAQYPPGTPCACGTTTAGAGMAAAACFTTMASKRAMLHLQPIAGEREANTRAQVETGLAAVCGTLAQEQLVDDPMAECYSDCHYFLLFYEHVVHCACNSRIASALLRSVRTYVWQPSIGSDPSRITWHISLRCSTPKCWIMALGRSA